MWYWVSKARGGRWTPNTVQQAREVNEKAKKEVRLSGAVGSDKQEISRACFIYSTGKRDFPACQL